jgi:hypothetical protein
MRILKDYDPRNGVNAGAMASGQECIDIPDSALAGSNLSG